MICGCNLSRAGRELYLRTFEAVRRRGRRRARFRTCGWPTTHHLLSYATTCARHDTRAFCRVNSPPVCTAQRPRYTACVSNLKPYFNAVSSPSTMLSRRPPDAPISGSCGHQNESSADPPADGQDILQHFPARFPVEVPRRLVREDQLGPVDERPCDSHPLLLASRQLARLVMPSDRSDP